MIELHILYQGTALLLAVFALHRVYLLWMARVSGAAERPQCSNSCPFVTVQLPIFNEKFVASRVIDSAARLEYPKERLEIQVLDDSADETAESAQARVRFWKSEGANIHYIHRRSRSGYKAGALAEGLKRAKGELIAIFDADFVPEPSFLTDLVPYFSDRRVGMVQAGWKHINERENILTRAESIFLDSHFEIEQRGRSRADCFFNFNGTAGIWRREAIEDAGGWCSDTLTEDLDLSYRAQLRGWKFVYAPETQVASELPADAVSFKSQQYRWAKGAGQTARKLLPEILTAPIPLQQKLEAFFHLMGNISYLAMAAFLILSVPRWITLPRGDILRENFDAGLFVMSFLSVGAYFVVSQRRRGKGWGASVRDLPILMGIGFASCINSGIAYLSGWLSRDATFVRTPKRGEERARSPALYRTQTSNFIWVAELAMAAYLFTTFWMLVGRGSWWAATAIMFPLGGFLYMAVQALRVPFRLKPLPHTDSH